MKTFIGAIVILTCMYMCIDYVSKGQQLIALADGNE